MPRVWLSLLLSGIVACPDDDGPADAGGAQDAGPDAEDGGADHDGGTAPGWFVAYQEDFETEAALAVSWRDDEVPDDGPYADGGSFFRGRGDFQHGGQQTYTASLDAAAECVWHFNQTPAAGAPCEGADWPAGAAWPDWFMFGDPHVNYYEGVVHYDGARLELWRD